MLRQHLQKFLRRHIVLRHPLLKGLVEDTDILPFIIEAGLALKAFQDDPEGLEDLLLVAIQDAQTKAHELSEKEMAKELGGVGQMLGKLF